jgi:hypothetical protein
VLPRSFDCAPQAQCQAINLLGAALRMTSQWENQKLPSLRFGRDDKFEGAAQLGMDDGGPTDPRATRIPANPNYLRWIVMPVEIRSKF